MSELDVQLAGKSLADYTNTQLRLALGAVLYTNTADMWKQYLNQIGYTGDVSQMLQKYYADYNVPSNFRNYINAGASIFNPQNMFAVDAALQGYVYDINDLSTLYLDSAGTTPASINGAVGLVLDKSKNVPVARRNLLTYSEQFDNAVWDAFGTKIVTANQAVSPDGTNTADKLSCAPNNGIQVSGIAISASTTYTFSVYAKSDTSLNILLSHATTGGSGSNGSVDVAISTGTSVGDGWYRMSYTFTSASGDTSAVVRIHSSNNDATPGIYIWGAQLDVGSLATEYQRVVQTEGGWLAGNHAYQATTGNKPVLRGTPVGGNLVTNGDFASGTGWTAGAGWAIGSGVATATTSSSTLTSTLAATASKNYRVTYTITRSAGSVQVSFGGRSGASRSAAGTYVDYLDSTTNTNALVFTGTGFSGTVDNIEVVDVTAGSVKAPYALQFDGMDDFLQTASVNFTATDKMTVCHGVRKLSDAALGVVVELGTSVFANAGAFWIVAPDSAASNLQFRAGGTTTANLVRTGLVSPTTLVVLGKTDISGDSLTLRVNQTETTSSGEQGTGNLRNDVLYFGRRAGTSNPFNGLMFSAICVGKTASATELANIERWVNLRTGAY